MAQVPPARAPGPPDGLLDAIAITEAVRADDVAGVAAILRHCDLAETAAVLDSLMAYELISFSPLGEAFGILKQLAQELGRDSSPGNTVITLARQLGVRWCEDCLASHDFRDWALKRLGYGCADG